MTLSRATCEKNSNAVKLISAENAFSTSRIVGKLSIPRTITVEAPFGRVRRIVASQINPSVPSEPIKRWRKSYPVLFLIRPLLRCRISPRPVTTTSPATHCRVIP